MAPFMFLHAIASPRGDGLRPELLRLVEARQALSSSGVVDLCPRQSIGREQAGPHPLGNAGASLAKDVLLFPGREPRRGKAR
jgi:hypothetical protein